MILIGLTLNRKGYEPFIDYVKGLAIIFVVLTHLISTDIHKYTWFCLWGDMAVPLFLIIQVFHAYKKDQVILKWKQICRRIIVPFIIMQVIICLSLIIWNRKIDVSSFEVFGNLGPGAYYPYIYFQFTILLWMIAPLVRKVKTSISLLFIFVIASQLLELSSIYLHIPSDIYRFLFFRYTFLIYLGCLIAKDELVLNRWTFVISLISLFFILMFDGIIGGGKNLSCLFYMDGWRLFHWICYFHVAYILLFLLKWSFDIMDKNSVWKRYLINCGKYSYEIFLFQMFFLTFSPINILCSKFLGDNFFVELTSIILNIAFITIPIILVKSIKKYSKTYMSGGY